MFWIIGGNYLFHRLASTTDWAFFNVISTQLTHVQWDGFHAYDLIFPLFMFTSGVSLTLSIGNRDITPVFRLQFLIKAAKRAAIFVVLGVIYNFSWSFDPDRFRLASVLGQIGIAYLFSAILFLYIRPLTGRLIGLAAILLVVAILQLAIPVPGYGAGVMTPEGIINGWIDRTYLPGLLYGGTFDPEGILCIFSSTSVTFIGALAGSVFLKNQHHNPLKIIIFCLMSGTILIILSLMMEDYYPMIKAAWTVPFNLLVAGLSLLFLAVFYGIIDVLHYQRWAAFFTVIGMNSIAIYIGARFLSSPIFKMTLSGGPFDGPYLALMVIVMVIFLEWLVLRYCYQKGWFLKV